MNEGCEKESRAVKSALQTSSMVEHEANSGRQKWSTSHKNQWKKPRRKDAECKIKENVAEDEEQWRSKSEVKFERNVRMLRRTGSKTGAEGRSLKEIQENNAQPR